MAYELVPSVAPTLRRGSVSKFVRRTLAYELVSSVAPTLRRGSVSKFARRTLAYELVPSVAPTLRRGSVSKADVFVSCKLLLSQTQLFRQRRTLWICDWSSNGQGGDAYDEEGFETHCDLQTESFIFGTKIYVGGQ